LYAPIETTISKVLPVLNSRVLIAGEGHGGETFSALLGLFGGNQEAPNFSV